MRLRTQGGVETPFQFKYWVSDGGGSPRRSAPVLGRSNVGTRASPNGIGRIGTTGARCARGRAHSDNIVVRRHLPITPITPLALPVIFGGREKTKTNGYCWQPVLAILESGT